MNRVKKVTYLSKFRLVDCKELSLLRLSPRLFRPLSEIRPHLFSIQQIYFTKEKNYCLKLRFTEHKELSVSRPSPR